MPATEPASRGGAAEAPVNLLRHQDLVGGFGPSSCTLVPGQHLGAIALADASTRARQWASCSAEGVGGSTDMGVGSLMPPAYDHPPGPQQLRTITQALWRPDVSAPAKRRSAYLGAVPHSCY